MTLMFSKSILTVLVMLSADLSTVSVNSKKAVLFSVDLNVFQINPDSLGHAFGRLIHCFRLRILLQLHILFHLLFHILFLPLPLLATFFLLLLLLFLPLFIFIFPCTCSFCATAPFLDEVLPDG